MALEFDDPVEIHYDSRPVEDDLILNTEGLGDPDDNGFILVDEEPIREVPSSEELGSILVFPDDLYEKIDGVLTGKVQIPPEITLRIEPIDTGFKIIPPLRVGTPFVLPKERREFVGAVQMWTPDNQGVAYKYLHEALFPATSEE
jgi:hypothetical protein